MPINVFTTPASMGSSAEVGQLVQSMARLVADSGGADALNTAALGADASQESFLTTPQHV
jgi:hypothetical protein